MSFYFGPYVSVAQKKAKALAMIAKLRKTNPDLKPIDPFNGAISKTFWGKSWCENLEQYADYEYRLDRGRSYMRHGCICDLDLTQGNIKALVNGSELYRVEIAIKTLEAQRWAAVCEKCQGKIGSLVELLQGKFSKQVMEIVTDPKIGLFPAPKDIQFHCSCPDVASLCKHVAAVLYAIGRRLDTEPDLLFTLRGVDATELLPGNIDSITDGVEASNLEVEDVGALFDIDLESGGQSEEVLAQSLSEVRQKSAEKAHEVKEVSSAKKSAEKATTAEHPSLKSSPSKNAKAPKGAKKSGHERTSRDSVRTPESGEKVSQKSGEKAHEVKEVSPAKKSAEKTVKAENTGPKSSQSVTTKAKQKDTESSAADKKGAVKVPKVVKDTAKSTAGSGKKIVVQGQKDVRTSASGKTFVVQVPKVVKVKAESTSASGKSTIVKAPKVQKIKQAKQS